MSTQLVLENVGVLLPNRVLFEEVNWSLYDGMRVALAGRNGSGKSTLLKIMAGQLEPTTGKCSRVGGKNLRIGFLDQTLLDKAVLETKELKDKSTSPMQFLRSRMEMAEEYLEVDWEIRKVLVGLGFSIDSMNAPMNRLSGGWLLRLFIGATLLDKPELLLLDEPTNHLDLSSIQWLEEFLEKEYEGSLILVTHDVALQKRVTSSLAVLHGCRFYFHTHQKDYLTFRESLIDEKRLLEKNIESLQKKIDENMEFVYKFRAKAQTAARAQSKLKMAETLTEERNALKDQLSRVEGATSNMHFQFRLSGAGAKFPVSLKNLSFQYKKEAPWILKHLSFDIKRGERVAILGDNGAGKTTLLNVIAERLKPTEGQILHGHAVETGYFGQHQLDELLLEDSVLDNLRARAMGVSLEEMRGWLGAFGFHGNDDIGKKVKVLSGGERARLALLRILVTRVNLCLLDEPTNHLDIETKAILTNAIKAFEGTAIFVSHDRDFVTHIADRILYLTEDHDLTDHFGNLESFFEKYPQFVRHAEGRTNQKTPKKESPSQLSYEERKKIKNQTRSFEKKIALIEKEMEELTNTKEKAQAAMTQQNQTAQFEVLAKADARLHELMVEWEKTALALEEIKSKT